MSTEYRELMDDGKTPRCQQRVYHSIGNWGHSVQCRRAGKADDETGWHCKQHSDAEVQRRKTEKNARYDKEWAARRLQIHGPHFHGVLKQIADGHNDARGLARETLDDFERDR